MTQEHETRTARRQSRTTAQPTRSQLPSDRFENAARSVRVGAHRAIAQPRRFWIYLVTALVGIVLLTGTGIVALQVTGANLRDMATGANADVKAQKKPPTVKAQLDSKAQVGVLNGTSLSGFESVVEGAITENNWGQILFSAPAASNEVKISAVFYSDPADEAAALGLAKQLGGVSTFQSSDYDEYGVRLIVLLGADYAGPGSEQLAAHERAVQ